VAAALLERTGFALVVDVAGAPIVPVAGSPPLAMSTGHAAAATWAGQRDTGRQGPPAVGGPVIQVPLARIQLSAAQRAMPLDPDKTRRAIDRAQRAGGSIEPLQLRRVGDGYRLVDGLRRLAVAQALGWETVPAVVDEG
jgi:hypothetical protein